jgi:formamidopyrimidine-DNA glycosylase
VGGPDVSIELPEAKILAEQMNKELGGKHVKSYLLRDCEKLQRMGMINKDTKAFDQLVGREIESVLSRGNVIRVKLGKGMNLILGPEYGGEVFYHENGKEVTGKFHLKADFDDGTALTVRLTSMGIIQALRDSNLEQSYVFRRDFNMKVPSPIEEAFVFERFSALLDGKDKALKSVLVGKDSIVVGLSNSAFQDILYRAGLHPKRKASELSEDERLSLYDAIKLVMEERIRLNGKNQVLDLYGNQGSYTPAMGPNMKNQACPTCATPIEKLSIGGGDVYFCSKCQK